MSPAEIRALRAILELTQEQFAAAVGVTCSSVNRWENGHCPPSPLAVKNLNRLADDPRSWLLSK